MQKEAREVQRFEIINKVSYTEALKKVWETGTNNRNSRGMAQRNAVQSRHNIPGNQVQTQDPVPMHCPLVVNKVNFVVFICHTINTTAEKEK